MLTFKFARIPLVPRIAPGRVRYEQGSVVRQTKAIWLLLSRFRSSKQSFSFDVINGLSSRLMARSLQMFWVCYKALSMFDTAGHCVLSHTAEASMLYLKVNE